VHGIILDAMSTKLTFRPFGVKVLRRLGSHTIELLPVLTPRFLVPDSDDPLGVVK
jgi:hypothetical protein